jgi:UDP:flavonoid glycosyltransferase YjiC (YdhE family)
MKCVVAGYGSRGDVEPCIAIARELARRGHDVRMAVTVPPDMVAVVESAGLTAVPYGRDWEAMRTRAQPRIPGCGPALHTEPAMRDSGP